MKNLNNGVWITDEFDPIANFDKLTDPVETKSLYEENYLKNPKIRWYNIAVDKNGQNPTYYWHVLVLQ